MQPLPDACDMSVVVLCDPAQELVARERLVSDTGTSLEDARTRGVEGGHGAGPLVPKGLQERLSIRVLVLRPRGRMASPSYRARWSICQVTSDSVRPIVASSAAARPAASPTLCGAAARRSSRRSHPWQSDVGNSAKSSTGDPTGKCEIIRPRKPSHASRRRSAVNRPTRVACMAMAVLTEPPAEMSNRRASSVSRPVTATRMRRLRSTSLWLTAFRSTIRFP